MNYPIKTARILAVFKIFKKHYKLIPLEVFRDNPYKNLVATALSSRTRDEVTLTAANRLFKIAPNIKTLSQLPARNAAQSAAGGEISIEEFIYPVGFYKTKAQHLKQTAQIIIEKYDGKVPRTFKELTELPGVGRKTANIVLGSFGIPAISVDTHVHKIANLLRLVKTKAPEQTEKELMKLLPKKYWPNINRLFVSIGRQFRSKRKLLTFLKENRLIA